MSGASLAGVARAAASRALERAVTDFAGHISGDSSMRMESEGNSISDCLVTQEDFEKAVEDVFESARSADYTETVTTSSSSDDESNDNESDRGGDGNIETDSDASIHDHPQ